MKSPPLYTSSQWGLDKWWQKWSKGCHGLGDWECDNMKETNYFSLYIYIYIYIPLIYSFSLNEHPCVRDGLFGSHWIIVHNFKNHVEEATSCIYMYTIIIIIYGKRNPQPFEGSICLIKIPIQGCYVALIERKEKLFPCVWCMNILCFHQWKHFWTVETTNMSLPWPHKSPYSIFGDFVKYLEKINFVNIFGQGHVVSINLPS